MAEVVQLDLTAVNAMGCEEFVAAVGPSFENSPWIARAVWPLRPFASVAALHDAMLTVIRQAPQERQLEFLRGHPELAGREAQAGTMTDVSKQEQASAGLDALSRPELDEMARLNRTYRERHGFPFIIAVRRHTKAQIFAEMRRRTGLDSAAERTNALEQIAFITRGRIEALLGA